MSDWAEMVVSADDPQLASPFVKEMVRQMRAIDSYGLWDKAGDHEILDPFVLTRERKQQVPIVGDPDEAVISRLKAWYNALSSTIEQRTGMMAIPLVHLSHEGFGRAIIAVGKLIVTDKTLRDVHRFGFRSLDEMAEEAEKIVGKAVALLEAHRAVAEL